MSPSERRGALLEWMRSNVPMDHPRPVSWIVYLVNFYFDPRSVRLEEERCRRDMLVLERQGQVRRVCPAAGGYPALWDVVR